MIPWARRDWLGFAALVVVIALLHIVGFGALILLVGPHHYQVGTQLFGIGLGVTAYAFGLRHAFDADHIVAIDNTTRKLMTDRGDVLRPVLGQTGLNGFLGQDGGLVQQ